MFRSSPAKAKANTHHARISKWPIDFRGSFFDLPSAGEKDERSPLEFGWDGSELSAPSKHLFELRRDFRMDACPTEAILRRAEGE